MWGCVEGVWWGVEGSCCLPVWACVDVCVCVGGGWCVSVVGGGGIVGMWGLHLNSRVVSQ